MSKIYERLEKCYECFKSKIDFEPDVELVLGSGLGDFADGIKIVAALDYCAIAAVSYPPPPPPPADPPAGDSWGAWAL